MSDKRDLEPEVEREITRRYMAGERAGALAAAFQINRKTVLTIVKRNGGEVQDQRKASGRRPWRQFSEEDVARMTDLWTSGKSQTFIARQFDTTQIVVSRVLRGSGVTTPLERRSGNKTGSAAHGWKGGIIAAPGGYRAELVAPSDPMAAMRTRMGYVLQHRLVMARALGRPLGSHETVHHINGDRADNRLENLQLRQGRHGTGVRYICADCGSHNVVTTAIGRDV